MKKLNFVILGALAVLLASCGGGGGGGGNPPATTNSLDNKDFIVDVYESDLLAAEDVDSLAELAGTLEVVLNENVSLPDRDVVISFLDCGQVNAFYSPKESALYMCHDLLASLLGSGVYTSEDSLDVFLFVLFHELGHAFVDQYELSILGSEEDAADAISTVLMIDIGSESQAERLDGARAVILAGDFLNSSGAINWADIHSVGPQRMANLVCWAWGAVPEVADEFDISNIIESLVSSSRDCAAEYQVKAKSVENLIGRYLKG